MSAPHKTAIMDIPATADMPSTTSVCTATMPNYAEKDPRKWSTTDVLEFLQDNKEEDVFEEADIYAIWANKVSGHLLLELTRDDFRGDPYNLADGTARALVKIISSLKLAPSQLPVPQLMTHANNLFTVQLLVKNTFSKATLIRCLEHLVC